MATIDKMLEKLHENGKKVEQFSDILDQIDNASEKKKMLWKEIYENAVIDRTNAYILFTDLYTQMGSSSDHATLGLTLTKYMERMSKSNEQLLNLSKQISDSESASASSFSEDDIFDRIKK